MANEPQDKHTPERSGDSSLKRRLAYSAGRWAQLLVLVLLGAAAFELILPVVWHQTKSVQLPYSPVFVAFTTCVAVVLLAYVLSEPIRIRKHQWRRVLWYPPAWLAIPLAWGLAAASERLPVGFRPQTSGPAWQQFELVAPIELALVLALALRQLPWRKRVKNTPRSNTADQPSLTWREIEEWILGGERPITSGERDLFQHRRIAARVARNIGVDRRHVALLGRFGSGKSSILNLVAAELAQYHERLIVADFDVWAVPNPEDVPRLALNSVISALDDYVDTTQFRGLPLAYQRLAAAEPTGRFSAALGLETTRDSIELLKGLSRVLACVGVRVVLIVQDVERAGQGFDTRHLQRLLWALRNATGIHFILSVDPDHAPLDFPKLCDSIELVPSMEVDDVARILTIAYGHWRTRFSDIDPHPRRHEGDKFRLGQALAGGMTDYMRRTGKDTPLDALVSLLDTPRSLKHVLRRVDHAWNNLHGEAELDDILIVSALRHGAEPAYRFLLADIDAARHKPDDILPRTKKVKDEWARVLADLPNGPAAQRLVDLMGIEQLTNNTFRTGADSPQGVHESEPVDYFRRIVAEELAPSEPRDQAVLRDIERWKASRATALVDRLMGSSSADEDYVSVWEHFSDAHTDDELMELVERIVGDLKRRDGSSAAADHAALIALWRRCNRRLHTNENTDWLRSLILEAVPVSLHLANGLYYYWTGSHGIVDGSARDDIRRSVVETVRSTFRSGLDLAQVLAPEHPYLIGRLITQTGSDRGPAAFEAWSDYLAPILIEGARERPEILMPELANMAGDEQSGMVAAGGEYPPTFINRYGIDRTRMTALFQDRLDEVLALLADYAGDNAYAVRAKDAASAWLDERRGRATPRTEQPVPSEEAES